MTDIEEKEYRCAYKEIVTILEIFSNEIGDKISKEKIDFYKENMDLNHEFEYDYSKEISEQNILYKTKCILANLYEDYLATEEEKLEILKEEKEYLANEEKIKREKYNPDDIFKNKYEKTKIEVTEMHTDLIVHDENITWFEKIRSKINELLNKFFKNKFDA